MRTQEPQNQKGFTSAEKWIIWSIFCFIVALSTHIIVLPAMLLVSWGIVRLRWQFLHNIPFTRRLPAVVVFGLGTGLIWWAFRLLKS